MKKLRILLIGFSFLCLSFGSPTTASATNPTGVGGSWFMWYQNDGTYDHSCYGVIRNYNQSAARSAIQSNLWTMYNNGQRRLGISMWFGRGDGASASCPSTDTGSAFDSSSSSDMSQYMQNLYDYINYAQNTVGFPEVMIAMGPLTWTGTGAFYNDPGYAASAYSTYASWKSAYFSENYGVIQALRAKLSGLLIVAAWSAFNGSKDPVEGTLDTANEKALVFSATDKAFRGKTFSISYDRVLDLTEGGTADRYSGCGNSASRPNWFSLPAFQEAEAFPHHRLQGRHRQRSSCGHRAWQGYCAYSHPGH